MVYNNFDGANQSDASGEKGQYQGTFRLVSGRFRVGARLIPYYRGGRAFKAVLERFWGCLSVLIKPKKGSDRDVKGLSNIIQVF